MSVSGQIGSAHSGQKLTKAGVSPDIGAQDQGINEKADQFFERVIGAASSGTADRNIGAGPQPAEQGGQAGLEHHKEARSIVPGQGQQLAVELPLDSQREPRSASPAPRATASLVPERSTACLYSADEMLALRSALARHQGNLTRAAAELGITRPKAYRMLRSDQRAREK